MTQPPSDCSEGSLIPSIFFRPFGREIKGSWVEGLRRKNPKGGREDWVMRHSVRMGQGGSQTRVQHHTPLLKKAKKFEPRVSEKNKLIVSIFFFGESGKVIFEKSEATV
jgi:hypothetical protein